MLKEDDFSSQCFFLRFVHHGGNAVQRGSFLSFQRTAQRSQSLLFNGTFSIQVLKFSTLLQRHAASVRV